jgi:hypothetical protein
MRMGLVQSVEGLQSKESDFLKKKELGLMLTT